MNDVQDFGCKKCERRGDLRWLSTHSHKPGQEYSPVLSALWRALGFLREGKAGA